MGVLGPSIENSSEAGVLTPVLDRLLNRMLIAVLILMLPTMFAYMMLVGDEDWYDEVLTQVAAYLATATLLLARNRVPARARAIAFLAIVFFISCWSMLTWGLLGAGPVLFLVGSLMAAMLFGVRGGGAALVLSGVAMVGIWLAWDFGWRQSHLDVTTCLEDPLAWVTVVTTTLSLSLVLMLSLASVLGSFTESFASLRGKTHELEESNARLQEEMLARQELEDTLTDERRFLESVIDSLPGGFYVYDEDCRLVRWNRNMELFTGLPPDQLLNHHILDWFEGTDRENVADGVREAFAHGHTRRSAFMVRRDGTRIPYEFIGQRAEIGGKVYLLGLGLDMAERRLREEEQARLGTLVDQSPDAIVMTDPAGVIQYVNRSFQNMTGYSAEEVIGQTPRILKSGQHDAAFYQELWATLLRGETWKGQITNKNKQGNLYTEDATISPVWDSQGRVINYLAIKRDMTQRLTLETRLRQAQKMEAIGTLAGGIAHDFNNILTGILGYTALAMSDVPQDSMVYRSLEQVASAGRRAAELVAQILTFSRQTERERRPLLVHTVVKEALKLLRGSIPSTIEIRQSISTSCGPVLADPTEIHQIVMNLCTNAYHAMIETGGLLKLEMSQVCIGEQELASSPELKPGDYIRLAVSDTGHGMTRDVQARLFEPYFTTKPRGEGTGLGLSTVHGIVQDAGGTIHVYSEPGNGATFVVFLPVVAGEGPSAEVEAVDERELLGSERVLFVDDEESNALFAKAALERLGYEVTTLCDSRDALSLFRANPYRFDVLITDQMMPGMTGVEMSMNMLAYRPDFPVILCSGFSELPGNVDRGAAVIRERVMKPVIASDLAKAIRRVIGKKGTNA